MTFNDSLGFGFLCLYFMVGTFSGMFASLMLLFLIGFEKSFVKMPTLLFGIFVFCLFAFWCYWGPIYGLPFLLVMVLIDGVLNHFAALVAIYEPLE